MMFVDGAYLRAQMEKNLGNYFVKGTEKTRFEADLKRIFGEANKIFMGSSRADLVRIYFYDGVSDDKKHEQIRVYHDVLRKMNDVQVNTIPLVISSTGDGYKQKGIDTLIAIDMLSKAFENHYDVAYLLTGDADLIPVINAVKDDAGKKVYGIYFEDSYSDDLSVAFDREYLVPKYDILSLLIK
jgi:uncharacterized LabA/DUF88 family protein